MNIEVINEADCVANEERLLRLANFMLQRMYLHPETALNVVLVSPAAISELHEQWMQLPGPTDVLSFPMDELRPGVPECLTPAGILGDLVLCVEIAAEQAAAADHSLDTEMAVLVVHGILHLLGYDHVEPLEEAEMFALQRQLVQEFFAQEDAR